MPPRAFSLLLDHTARRYLLHAEADVAAVVEPDRQRVPVRDQDPLPHVELPPGDDQGVLR